MIILTFEKMQIKFAFLLTYSYLCTRKVKKQVYCRDGGMVDTRDLKSLGQ